MVTIQKGSKNALIVIHEIYGINPHILGFCESISKQGFDVFCPNLIAPREAFDYTEEKLAYQHFMENVGFAGALFKIEKLLIDIKERYQKIFIIGYSVGATVAWLCNNEKLVDGIVGFYGSRIRDYINVSPKCPTLLFFPEEEKSFQVDELIAAIGGSDIEIHKCVGQHGFSDPYSQKYNEESAKMAYNKLVTFLKEQSS